MPASNGSKNPSALGDARRLVFLSKIFQMEIGIKTEVHRVGVGSWEGRNFYQIRPASEVCNFYKIRPEILDQLLHFKARFQIFSAAFGGRVLGSNFRLVRLDLGPVQDVGIPVREHSAGIKTSKSEFWGGQNPHFFRPAGETVSTARWPVLDMPSRGRPGRELSMASSFYQLSLHPSPRTAFTK